MNTEILNEFDCNNVQIFILENINDTSTIELNTDRQKLNKIRNKYNFKKNRYVSFYYNNLHYQYDKSNDNQNLTSKKTKHVQVQNQYKNNTYNVYSIISKLPTYLFPCIDNIDNKIEYEIEEYKINNRVSLCIKSDEYSSYLYIEYNHSSQVEIEKIENCIKNILSYISSV
jgi:hypothetical protein